MVNLGPLGHIASGAKNLPSSSSPSSSPPTSSSSSSGSSVKFGSLTIDEAKEQIQKSSSSSSSSSTATEEGYAKFKAEQIVSGGGMSAYSLTPQDVDTLRKTSEGQILLNKVSTVTGSLRDSATSAIVEAAVGRKTTKTISQEKIQTEVLPFVVENAPRLFEEHLRIKQQYNQTPNSYEQFVSGLTNILTSPVHYKNALQGQPFNVLSVPVTFTPPAPAPAPAQPVQAPIQTAPEPEPVKAPAPTPDLLFGSLTVAEAKEQLKQDKEAELQKQAEQKVLSEAFSEAVSSTQKAGGGLVTTEKIVQEAQNLLEGKYSEGIQVTDKQAQNDMINTAYAAFKGEQIVDALNKGATSAHALSDHDVKLLEKAGVEDAKDLQTTAGIFAEAKAAEVKINKAIDEVNSGKPLSQDITAKDIAALEKAGVQDAKSIAEQIMFAGGKGGNSDAGYFAPRLGGGILNANLYEAKDDIGNVTSRVIIPHVDLTKTQLVKDVEKPTGNVLLDFGKGAYAEGENLVKSLVASAEGLKDTWMREAPRTIIDTKSKEVISTTKPPEIEFKPTPETDAISLTFQAGQELATKGQTSVKAEDYSKVLQNIYANPSYAVGALGVSAAGFLFPSSKALSAGKSIGKAATAITYARAIKPIATRVEPVTSAAIMKLKPIKVGLKELAFETSHSPTAYAIQKAAFQTGQTIKAPFQTAAVDLRVLQSNIGKIGANISDQAGLVKEAAIEKVYRTTDFIMTKLPELPKFGTGNISQLLLPVKEVALLPVKGAKELAGRTADVAASVVDAGTAKLQELRLQGQQSLIDVVNYATRGGVIPDSLERFRYIGMKPLDQAGIAGRTVGRTLDRGLDPYRQLNNRIQNFVDESIATYDADTLKYTPQGKIAEAANKLLEGSITGIETTGKKQARFDIGTELSTDVFAAGYIDAGRKEIKFITREPLSAEELAKVKTVAKSTEEVFSDEKIGRKDVTAFGEIADGTVRTTLPKTIPIKLPIFAEKLTISPNVDEVLSVFTNVPRAAKTIKVGDIITYSTDDILKYAKARRSAEEVQYLTGNEASEILGLSPRKSTPFRYIDTEKAKLELEKRSSAPLDVTEQFAFDRELQRYSPSAAAASSSAKVAGAIMGLSDSHLGLGGNAAAYTNVGNLGLGGATKRLKRPVEESTYSTFAYPSDSSISTKPSIPSSVDSYNNDLISRVNEMTGNILKDMTNARDITSTGQRQFDITKTDQANILDTGTKINTDVTQAMKQVEAQMTKTIQTHLHTTMMRTEVPQMRTPKIPPLLFGFPNGYPSTKKRGRKGKSIDYSERLWKLGSVEYLLFGGSEQKMEGFDPFE